MKLNDVVRDVNEQNERLAHRRSARRPRVILADAHRIVGEGLSRLLADEFDFVSVVDSGERLFEAACHVEADLILSDIKMASVSTLAVLKRLRDRGSRVPFVFVTMHAEPAIAAEAVRAGASGYVLKSASVRELKHAVCEVLEGRCYVAASIAASYLASDDARTRLSNRQQKVLELVAQGFSSKQIARVLSLSIRTIEAHKYSMMQILRVHSSVELVRRAREIGFLA